MIIVTGGAGFIGSSFICSLNKKNIDDIIVVDSLGVDEKWNNLNNIKFRDFILKENFLDNLDKYKNAEAVVHFGACSSTYQMNCDYLVRNNFDYSKQLCLWALENGIRFVYASSAATYGLGENGFSDSIENALKLKPINPYGFSKQLFDLWLINNGYIGKVLGYKFFNVFGPNEYHKKAMRSMIYHSYYQIIKNSKVRLFKSYHPDYKDGMQSRDFVYIKDVVEIINQTAFEKNITGFLNVGTGISRTFLDLASAVFKAMNKVKVVNFIDMKQSLKDKYQYYTKSENTKLNKNCNYKFTNLEDAVYDYVNNYISKGERRFNSR